MPDAHFQQLQYSGLDPALAFDIVYGGHFEHRLLSAQHSNMQHCRLSLPSLLLESGCYDFPVIAKGVMPKGVMCIGLMASGIEVTRYNTADIEQDEIQLYPPGADLLYHAVGASRWINLIVQEEQLQAAAVAYSGRPLELPRRDAISVRLSPGHKTLLRQLADDAFALAQAHGQGAIPSGLVKSLDQGLIDAYAQALSDASPADAGRSANMRQYFPLIIACERLAQRQYSQFDLEDIAKRSGYSRRALELIFNRFLGMPPGRWFLNARLNGVMRELLTAAPNRQIADVAADWGFQHLSRFAFHYRRAFAELPSQTLQRARGR